MALVEFGIGRLTLVYRTKGMEDIKEGGYVVRIVVIILMQKQSKKYWAQDVKVMIDQMKAGTLGLGFPYPSRK